MTRAPRGNRADQQATTVQEGTVQEQDAVAGETVTTVAVVQPVPGYVTGYAGAQAFLDDPDAPNVTVPVPGAPVVEVPVPAAPVADVVEVDTLVDAPHLGPDTAVFVAAGDAVPAGLTGKRRPAK